MSNKTKLKIRTKIYYGTKWKKNNNKEEFSTKELKKKKKWKMVSSFEFRLDTGKVVLNFVSANWIGELLMAIHN